MGPIHWFLVDFLAKASWPIVGGGALFCFRGEVRDFLKRAIKMGPGGVEATPPQPPTLPPTGRLPGSASIARAPQTDEILSIIEKNIREDPKVKEADKLSPEEAKDFFVREYALLSLRAFFDNIGQNIFGTQIKLLRHLANQGPKTRDDIMFIYNEHEKKVTEAGSNVSANFDGWLTYLVTSNLIVAVDGHYEITPLGRKFISDFAPIANLSEATRRL